jgi:hypothetical protein
MALEPYLTLNHPPYDFVHV